MKRNFLTRIVIPVAVFIWVHSGTTFAQTDNSTLHKKPNPDAVDSEIISSGGVMPDPFLMEFEQPEQQTEQFLSDFRLNWKSNLDDYIVRSDHPFNPDDDLFYFDQWQVNSILDVNLNKELTRSIQVFARGIIRYDRSDLTDAMETNLLEGYLQWVNNQKSCIFNLGKSYLIWGPGYAWNPTNLVIQGDGERNISQKVSDVHLNDGVEMVFNEFHSDFITATIVMARLNVSADEPGDHHQAAVKLSFGFDSWDFSVVHHQSDVMPATSGISYSGLLNDSLEIHGEWSRTSERDRLKPVVLRGAYQVGPLLIPAQYGYVNEETKKEVDRILIGGQYTFANDANLIVEMYRTSHGYSQAEWDLIRDGIQQSTSDNAWANPAFDSALGNPYAGFLQNTMALLRKGQLRQNYLFLRWISPESNHLWQWEQVFMLNIDDRSQFHKAALHKILKEDLKIEVSFTAFFGPDDSEYQLSPYSTVNTVSLTYYF